MFGSIVSGALGMIGANKQNKAIAKANQQNRDMQYDFAKNSLQWKADDARAAGLHPLAALGAQGYSPTIGSMPESVQPDYSSAAANISNAISNRRAQSQAQKQLNMENARNNMVAYAQVQKELAQAQLYKAQAGDITQQQLAASALARTGQEQKRDDLTLVMPGGTIKGNPKHTPTETVEQEYGGIASEIYGLNRVFGEIGQWLGSSAAKSRLNPDVYRKGKRLTRRGYR